MYNIRFCYKQELIKKVHYGKGMVKEHILRSSDRKIRMKQAGI
jgi:hypothetical protein